MNDYDVSTSIKYETDLIKCRIIGKLLYWTALSKDLAIRMMRSVQIPFTIASC